VTADQWDDLSFFTINRLELWRASLRYAIRIQEGLIERPPPPPPSFTSEGAGEDQGPDFNVMLDRLLHLTMTRFGIEQAQELYSWCTLSLNMLDSYTRRYNAGSMDSAREEEAKKVLSGIEVKYWELHA
jgi:hypothetical protein